MQKVLDLFQQNLTLIIVIAACAALLTLANWLWIKRNPKIGAEQKLPRQIGMLLLTIVSLLTIILALPISDNTRGQILSLIGIVLTSIIALSSTTFVSNAMAGLMLRVINTFKPGDYLRFNDQLSRVTERGLFHTEVQNEDKDLITYPNLFLINNSVTVISHEGTLITCSLSLGYDVPRKKIEKHLILAAESIGLETPFVLIKSLGDFSVTYKISGFLNEVKSLVTWRSNLYKAVLDQLHTAEIEIVSPNFMNSRQFDSQTAFIPEKFNIKMSHTETQSSVEEKVFDKAEAASEKEVLIFERDTLLVELQKTVDENNEAKQTQLQHKIKLLDEKIALLST
ncbi:mechanosensitive ion channel family protein [Aliikangiella sp. IMCC44359]|uniref:mechanosensitive ion channel family protein n=1 Tax=Aliikangiella sp. IMCC44359 TaxID=3459125 RepID=UPI00403ACFB1